MKILQLHNYYINPGGEDSVASTESAMLKSEGHTVIEVRRTNHALKSFAAVQKIQFYLKEILHSPKTYTEVRELINQERPDIAHFHNSFFMLGPAAYQACFYAGVPVVQTLHNYRFLCANAVFFNKGAVCEECLTKGRSAGVLRACWQNSIPATFLMTRVIDEYRKKRILDRVSRFITLSNFSQNKFVAAGWPERKIIVKPNSLEKDPGLGPTAGKYVLYAGGLHHYKGVGTLLKAWKACDQVVPLVIAGTGPLERKLKKISGGQNVQFLGQRGHQEVIELIKGAICVVLPAECYENFPRVIIEAFACGKPVVGSRIGAVAELIEHEKTGFLFKPGCVDELIACLKIALSDRERMTQMGSEARRTFEERYSPKTNIAQLEKIYEDVLARFKRSSSRSPASTR